MNDSNSNPGAYPGSYPRIPGQPLSYWIDSDMARLAPETSVSALRDMAWSYGQWRGLALSMAGLGGVIFAGGLLALIMMPGVLGLWISLIVVGLALLGVGVAVNVTKLPAIAGSKQPRSSRAPGKTSSGVGLAVLIVLAVGTPLAIALHGWLSAGPGPAISFVLVALLFIAGSACAFVVPAYCAEHARRDFRAYITKNQALRTELESLSLSWQDPTGARNFGPL